MSVRPLSIHFLFDRGESYEAGSSAVACGGQHGKAENRTRDRAAVTCERCLREIREQESVGARNRAEQLEHVGALAKHVLTGIDGKFHEATSPEPCSSVYISQGPRPKIAATRPQQQSE